MGLSTETSWGLTPREFAALERVYFATIERWASDRAWFANAHFKKPDGSQFTADDFLGTPGALQRQAKHHRAAERAKADLDREDITAARHMRLFRQAMKDRELHAKIEKELPVWARMTEDEKKARGLM